jgi:LPXTG-motif cell wall-anchored protein
MFAALQSGTLLDVGPVNSEPYARVPVWQVQYDCGCAGGTWVEGVQGLAESGYCQPAYLPTGKRYDERSRGCVPIPGYRPPSIPAAPEPTKTNWLLWAGIAVGAGLLLYYADKKRKAGAKVAPKTEAASWII